MPQRTNNRASVRFPYQPARSFCHGSVQFEVAGIAGCGRVCEARRKSWPQWWASKTRPTLLSNWEEPWSFCVLWPVHSCEPTRDARWTAPRRARPILESAGSGFDRPATLIGLPDGRRSADGRSGNHDPETVVVVPIVGRVPVPIGRASVLGIVVPRTVTQHTIPSHPMSQHPAP